jgi:hypothetical protein
VVTALTLEGNSQGWPELPSIGRPIAAARIYLLDARGEPVPPAEALSKMSPALLIKMSPASRGPQT